MRQAARLMCVVAIGMSLVALVGCGGSGGGAGGPVVPQVGGVNISIQWPERPEGVDSALIPAASNSIKVELLQNGVVMAGLTCVINRPQTTGRIDDVPVGVTVMRASAHPETDGKGVAQAAAERNITVTDGQYSEWPLTLQSTITEVVVRPNPCLVGVYESLQLVATAMDGAGRTVLVPVSGAFAWSITEGESFASVDANGLLQGLAEGAATVRAIEQESTQAGTSEVQVITEPWQYAGAYAGQEIVGPDGGAMVWVPGGSFRMGSEYEDGDGKGDERPPRDVLMGGFWIGKHEVSNTQYQMFCVETARTFPADSNEGAGHPVFSVSWYDAEAYAAHYGLSLPTEAQWEYGARGPGGAIRYPWGATWEPTWLCWSGNQGPGGKTYPVGSFPTGASWCGALDMAGNVWEWCQDWYDATYYQYAPSENPPGPSSGTYKVLRGAAWSDVYSTDFLTAHRRGGALPTAQNNDCGFRCVSNPGG